MHRAADDRTDLVVGILHDVWDVLFREDNPFSNTGAEFIGERIQVQAYSWDDEYDQNYNFKWRDFEVSWYKHAGRGMTSNRNLSDKEVQELMSEGIADMCKHKAEVGIYA